MPCPGDSVQQTDFINENLMPCIVGDTQTDFICQMYIVRGKVDCMQKKKDNDPDIHIQTSINGAKTTKLDTGYMPQKSFVNAKNNHVVKFTRKLKSVRKLTASSWERACSVGASVSHSVIIPPKDSWISPLTFSKSDFLRNLYFGK